MDLIYRQFMEDVIVIVIVAVVVVVIDVAAVALIHWLDENSHNLEDWTLGHQASGGICLSIVGIYNRSWHS